MDYDRNILDREIGRNAQLFAQSVAEMETAEDRYPYLRILISLAEQAHPEWSQTENKHQQITELVHELSDEKLDREEIQSVVEMRSAERRAKK